MQRKQENNNMANVYDIEVQAQPSIYREAERSLKVYFAEPEDGISKDTGILLLFSGYENADVYNKWLQQFADSYNFVTVRCDYFGYEFMQDAYEVDIDFENIAQCLSPAEVQLLENNFDKYKHILTGKIFEQKIDFQELPEYFNDMGLMQAIDNLRAVKVVLDIIADNGYQINENRIYAYGVSHGAYLAYLCNAFCPGLFTAIIDNSAYLTPYYLKNSREMDVFEDNMHIRQIQNYKAIDFIEDEEILNLKKLYSQFENNAEILCFAGETDNITSLEEKKAFLSQIERSKVETITKFRIERIRFKHTDHGLGSDFLELFHYANQIHLHVKENEWKKKKIKHTILFENVIYDTEKFQYEVRWEEGIPVLYRMKHLM